MAQAKTGTGKTLGFLIPVVQRILANDPILANRLRSSKRARPDDIRAIVISPTRELAEQIAVEAKKITSNTGIIVQTAVGGTQKRAMLQKTQREGCHLLVGTPGRLNDILEDPYSGVTAPKLDALVMDEADRLMDDGFSREIDQIKSLLPDPEAVPRQTLMFSATVPREVVHLVRETLRPGFHFVQSVNDNELPTHERVPQKLVKLNGFENITPTLLELITQEHKAAQAGEKPPFKAIIYFNSTAEVRLFTSVFYKLAGGFKRDGPLAGTRAYEIHSKLTQAQRSRASDDFRFCKSGILISSDVTARGMDFPNVTHVIQVGLPRDGETYVHRLGRTGRAGKEGEGWLLTTPFDFSQMRRKVGRMPLKEDNSLEIAQLDLSVASDMPENTASLIQQIQDAHQRVSPGELDEAFKGLFGAFQGYDDKEGLLEGANRLAEIGWGMSTPPSPPSFFNMGGRRRGGGGGGVGGGYGSGYGDKRGGYSGRSFSRDDRRGGYGDRSSGRDDRRGGYGDRSSGRDDRRGGYGDRSFGRNDNRQGGTDGTGFKSFRAREPAAY